MDLEAFGACESAKLEVDPTAGEGRLARLIYEFDSFGVRTTRNRVYPRSEGAREIVKLSRLATEGKLFGRLDHPDNMADIVKNEMSNAATRISEVKQLNDQRVRVVHDVLDTKNGRELHGIIKGGGRPGTSQRAIVHQWRRASKADLAAERIADASENDTVVFADRLRLVTYDIVTESGLPQANTVKAIEDANMLTRAQIESEAPAVFNEIKALGATEANATRETAIREAVESAKPAIIDAAVAPLKVELATTKTALEAAQAEHGKVVKALEGAGFKIGPAGAPANESGNESADVTALRTELAAKEARITTLQTACEDANRRIDALAAANTKGDVEKAVRGKYGQHRMLDRILKACESAKNVEEGLKLATEKAADIEEITRQAGAGVLPNHQPGHGSSYQPNATPTAERAKATAALNF